MSTSALKRLTSLALYPAPKNLSSGMRQLHTTGVKQMGSSSHGSNGGHGSHDSYDDYIHAEHMYNLPAMKNRTLKMGLAVFSVVAIGTAVPIVAVIFQQKKAKIM